jgi:hypothetical protein
MTPRSSFAAVAFAMNPVFSARRRFRAAAA